MTIYVNDLSETPRIVIGLETPLKDSETLSESIDCMQSIIYL